MRLGRERFSWCASNGAGLRKTKCLLIVGSDAARRRTQGRGFVRIKSPSAGRHTLPRQGRYCFSNCSAPVTRRAKGTSFKAVPGDAFQNPPPQVTQLNAPLLGASNYAATEITKLLLPCSKLCASTSSNMGLCGRTLLTRKTRICVSLKDKELL